MTAIAPTAHRPHDADKPTSAFLQDPDGNRIALSPGLYTQIKEFLLAHAGQADGTERITTGDAARILGVFQRTVARMLDAGLIPYVRPSEHGYRFMNMSDVTAYRKQRDAATSAALERAREIAEESGGYDTDYSDYIAQFDR